MKIASQKITPSWWRFGYVWLLISGPLCVVIAGFITLYVAWIYPDPVIDQNYYQHGLRINEMPAQMARNHAASPTK